MLRILSSVMMGLVCVWGGRFLRSLMIFFVDDVEWLYVCFLGVGCAPDGDVADEVGVCMHVV